MRSLRSEAYVKKFKEKKQTPARFLRYCSIEKSSSGDTNERQLIVNLGTVKEKVADRRLDLVVEFVNRALKSEEMVNWLKNQYGRRLIRAL